MQPHMMTVQEAAKILKRTERVIMEGLRQDRYPFGIAVKMPSGQWTYQIPRQAFENWMKYGKHYLEKENER